MIEKIAIIGAGNMGAAIARGLVKSGRIQPQNLWVSDPAVSQLDALRADGPDINTTNDNILAASMAQLVLIAVKPWLVEDVLTALDQKLRPDQVLGSIAAGINIKTLRELIRYGAAAEAPLYRIIPNTAIAIGESMTFIAPDLTTPELDEEMRDIFSQLGQAMIVTEPMLEAGMAVASCGIAYAMRYVRAAMEGAVQLGMTPAAALTTVLQTVKGAAALLEATGEHPEVAIDRVTTAGGVTIRGLNAMEAAGFSPAVVDGLLASH
ncbi:MAG: pyrroline-5-carboxylate reductase [Bacteroidales bacterium]|nr:pyrroline-5-carboxylate reductase [Bacteroidales bacterium]